MNCKIILSYDGSKFFGSQIQTSKKSVHSTLLKAFSVLNIETKLHFSGRTDKGVHALNQVLSCQIPKHFNNLEKLRCTLNSLLPNSIYIKKISHVCDEFHARYSARKRVYRYILSHNQQNPFEADYVLHYNTKLNLPLLHKALHFFQGTHDFSFFCKTHDKQTSIRTLTDLFLYSYQNYTIITISADGFLRTQIRLIVGMLLALNENKVSLEDIQKQINLQKQTYKKPAPATGLYLAKILY